MSRWVEETLHKHFRFRFKAENVLFEEQTQHQHLIVFENGLFGRVMMLDGVIQCTEKDEFIYHEMMAHAPLFAHGAARKVLIIGGGDGGVLREVLRHKCVEQATLCEIDVSVIELSRKYLDFISRGAFDNSRARIVISDGIKLVAETDERFDVIMIDSTDPIGPATVLFTKEFYAACKRCLTPGGILITQNGLPFVQGWELQQSVGYFRELFADAYALLLTTPTYIGGPMALGWACSNPDLRRIPLETLRQRFTAAGFETNYYTPEVHQAAFALPAYVKRLVEPAIEA